ncbi:MAG TPA: hypothetical protein VK458_06595, partial [Myxococcaceae bacterium]|nr:hypothetical protein [Myxococcaceae bacterium]
MSRAVEQASEPVTVEEQRPLASAARNGSQDEQAREPAPRSVPGPGQTLVGRYTVLGKLGQGGMGVVLAA